MKQKPEFYLLLHRDESGRVKHCLWKTREEAENAVAYFKLENYKILPMSLGYYTTEEIKI